MNAQNIANTQENANKLLAKNYGHTSHDATCDARVARYVSRHTPPPLGGVTCSRGLVWQGMESAIFNNKPATPTGKENLRFSTAKTEGKGHDMTVRIQRNPQAVWRAIRAFGGQDRMAEALAVEQPTVSAWGSGDRPVPWHLCVKIEAGTRRIAVQRGDAALVVTCEELQPQADWRQMLELARMRMAGAAS